MNKRQAKKRKKLNDMCHEYFIEKHTWKDLKDYIKYYTDVKLRLAQVVTRMININERR